MPVRIGQVRRRKGSKQSSLAMICLAIGVVLFAFVVSKRSAPLEARENSTQIVAQYDTVPVPVPAEPVPAGVKLSKVRFVNIQFPRHQLPDGAITEIAAFRDSSTLVPLPARLPLFPENLSGEAGDSSNPVIERIPPGMRAMTVRVDATSAVEGWASSGSIVDVLLVQKGKTSVVAEQVKVLSAERDVSPMDRNGAPSVPSTVTLLVTQDQCLAINTAVALGKIAFALRGHQDDARWGRTRFSSQNLDGTSDASARSVVNGYISVGNDSKAFALVDGRWVKTEVVPEGFLANRDSRSVSAD